MKSRHILAAFVSVLAFGSVCWWASAQTAPDAVAVDVVPGMPPVIDPANLYSETVAGRLSPAVVGALPRVYVPNRLSNTVSVIDPNSLEVIDTFKVGHNPQHGRAVLGVCASCGSPTTPKAEPTAA